MQRKAYPTDLTDTQWKEIQTFLSVKPKRGRPPQDLREIINGMLYIFRSGLDWRMMPHDLPPWQTVYGYYQRWSKDSTWEQLNIHLSVQMQKKLASQNSSLVFSWFSNRLEQIKVMDNKDFTQSPS